MAELGDFLLHATSQYASAKIEISVDMLDYGYISNSNNTGELRGILEMLTSGKEGNYPDLIRHAEKRLMECLPANEREKIERLRQVATGDDIAEAKNDLRNWQCNYGDTSHRERDKKGSIFEETPTAKEPAIRNSKKVSTKPSDPVASKIPTSRLSGRDFRAWEKYDVDAALDNIDAESKKPTLPVSKPTIIANTSSIPNVSKEEALRLSTRDKLKGNECMRSKDYQDACNFYSMALNYDIDNELRSVILCNRALANLKLDRFEASETDCDVSLDLAPTIKCFQRRGMIRYKRGKYLDAVKDFMKCKDDSDEAKQLYDKSVEKLLETRGDVGRRSLDAYLSSLNKQPSLDWVDLSCSCDDVNNLDNHQINKKKTEISSTSMTNIDLMTEDEVKQLANSTMSAGNYLMADCLYSKYLVKWPSSVSILNNRSLARYYAKRWTDAMDDCKLVLALNPDHIKAKCRYCSCLHEVYLLHGQIEVLIEARLQCDACLDVQEFSIVSQAIQATLNQPLVMTALNEHVDGLMINHNYSHALTCLDIMSDPDLHKLLTCLNEMQLWSRIISCCQSNNVNNNMTHMMIRCRARLRTNDMDGCLSDVKLLMTSNDQNILFQARELMNEIKPEYHIPVDDQDDDDESNDYKETGNAHLKAGQLSLAIEAYSMSIQIDSTNLASFNNRSLAHLKHGQYAEAVDDATHVLSLDVSNSKALYRRGCAYHQLALQVVNDDVTRRRKLLLAARDDLMKITGKESEVELRLVEADLNATVAVNVVNHKASQMIEEISNSSLPVISAQPVSVSVPVKPVVVVNHIHVIPPTKPPTSMYEFESHMHSLGHDMDAMATYLQLFKVGTIKRLFAMDVIQPQEMTSLMECVHTRLVDKDPSAAIRIMWGLCKLENFDFLRQLMSDADKHHAVGAIELLENRRSELQVNDSEKLPDLQVWK